MRIRTDLAHEAAVLAEEEGREIRGVAVREEKRRGLRVCAVDVLDEHGSRLLEKPVGRYVTLYLDGLARREEDAFGRSVTVAAELLSALLPDKTESVLVAGLGNRNITPDAVGPRAVEYTIVTRHLSGLPEFSGRFRPVSAISPGVLGLTGVETGEIIRGVTEHVAPDCVIAIDSLASGSLERLCSTIQISDAGLAPGSGVGNERLPLDRSTLGVPVIALGVPTVVDALTIARELDGSGLGRDDRETRYAGMIVTPKDVDSEVRDIAKVVGYSINLALHGVTPEESDLYLG